MQPFGELTNRTPSPAHPEGESGRAARKHSPWTAARQKKKTRSVHSSLLADGDADTAAQDCFDSPEALLKTGGCSSDIEAEYSLADGLSPADLRCSPADSPHSSPPIDRDQDADVHPAKAYIVDQQGPSSSPDLLAKFALAASANAGAARSPRWFGSAALQEELGDPAAAAAVASSHSMSELQHSTSAPSNVLFHRFDAAGMMQQHQQQPECPDSCAGQQGASSNQDQLQAAAAGAAAMPGRLRGLVARRRSWTGAETRQLQLGLGPSTGGSSSTGISRLAIGSCMGSRSAADPAAALAGMSAEAAGCSAAAAEEGFELRSRLGAERQSLYEDALQRLPWEGIDGEEEEGGVVPEHGVFLWGRWQQQQQHWGDTADGSYRLPAAEPLLRDAPQCSAEWYEQRLLEAAEEGDLAAAQQLWGCMQAAGIVPSRKVITNYLMCCYYGGGDPVEAEQVVRQMCMLADTEPDAMTARLLASIDISWQQLHCGC